MTTTCDFHAAISEPDACTGVVTGGGSKPVACDGYAFVVDEADGPTAWDEIERMRKQYRAETVDAILDTLADWWFDGAMPCGCSTTDSRISCLAHALTAAGIPS